MTGHDIIVIGGSAGGLEAVTSLLRGLRADLPAAVFVVLHTSPFAPGVLPRIFANASRLPVEYAKDGDPIRKGRVVLAPPDRHLLLKRRVVLLNNGPKENGFRPAVDPLFRTAATAFGPRVVGIVLSGGMDDGSWGLQLIKQAGGIAMVQDPKEATTPSMPESAIANADVDFVLPAADMAQRLHELAPGRVRATKGGDVLDILEAAEHGRKAMDSETAGGPPTTFTCPECSGNLWEFKEGKLLRYRCHVGHAYTEQSLRTFQSGEVEAALWSGLRALEERASLCRRMSARARERGFLSLARQDEQEANAADERAVVLRRILTGVGLPRSKRAGGSRKRLRAARGSSGRKKRSTAVRRNGQRSRSARAS